MIKKIPLLQLSRVNLEFKLFVWEENLSSREDIKKFIESISGSNRNIYGS